MLELYIGLESEYRGMICSSESSKERVKVSHVIVEYRVINHHLITSAFAKPPRSEFQSDFYFSRNVHTSDVTLPFG